MKKIIYLIAAAALAFVVAQEQGLQIPGLSSAPTAGESAVAQAYADQRSDVQVQGQGVVIKVLKDDTRGSQHQRFLMRVGSNGPVVLVAHNIDLAPRVSGLREGDTVGFAGEYEWNDKGGVIHWTHRDPRGRHEDGWLQHMGKTYQ